MTNKSIKFFIEEIYSKPPKEIYATYKTDVYFIDNIWSWDNLDLIVYGLEDNRNYRYILVIIDHFSKFGWTVLSKNKNAQTIKDSFDIILINSKRKPSLIETDRGKEFHNNIFQNFIKNISNKVCYRSSSFGSVYAERFNRSISDLLKKPVFERGDGNWIDLLPTITKQNNNRKLSSRKLTPIQASLKKNEEYV